MNTPHLHLLLNHVPTVGTIIAITLLILSFFRKNEGLRRVALELFCVIAIVTLPTYLSGVATQLALSQRPDVSKVVMAAHHDAAMMASVLMVLTGGAAWLALWQTRRIGAPRRGALGAVVVCSVLTFALMARAANIGGEIRHPEILLDPQAAAEVTAPVAPFGLTAAAVGMFVTGRTWVWPSSEALHFIGLWLLFGVVALINLRLLGVMKAIPFAAVHRLLPWAVLGLGINLITGMLFVLGAPGQYMENIAFFWKMALLLIAAADVLYLTVFDGPWEIHAGQDAATFDKAVAATAILAWIGVMYCGRMLPFIGNAF
jgi:hypothetical protein